MAQKQRIEEVIANRYGSQEYKKKMLQMERLSNKWTALGMLDGIKETPMKRNVATLLENQGRQILLEQSLTGKNGAHEQWSGIAIPLIRRIFANLLANEIMSVQPMNAPTGLVFTLDYKWANDRDGYNKGDSIYGMPYDKDGVWKGRFPYGEGLSNYTKNPFKTTLAHNASGITARRATQEDLRYEVTIPTGPEGVAYPEFYNPYWVISIPLTAPTNVGTNATLQSLLVDPYAIRSFKIEHDDIREIYPSYFTIENTDDDSTWPPTVTKLNFVVKVGDDYYESDETESAESTDVDIPFQSGNYTLYYTIQTFDQMRGDFEAGMRGNSTNPKDGEAVLQTSHDFDIYAPYPEIPEVNISLTSRSVSAITRKLKASFSPELQEDIAAYSNLDVEDELTKTLSGIIGIEIDKEMVDLLLKNAYHTRERWSTIPGEIWSADSQGFTRLTGVHRGSLNEWYATLVNKIQKVSNMIHKKTMRHGATFVVVSPEVATVIESMPGFMSDTDGKTAVFNLGTEKVGSINKRWTVYKYPYMDTNRILVGYKGDNMLDAGAVYAPYIPIITTPLFPDPSTLVRVMGMHTRYAKEILRPEFYGEIIVKGLQNF